MAESPENKKSANMQEEFRAGSGAAQAAKDTAQRGSEAMQQAGRASGEILQRGGEAGAQAMEHLGDATGETVRRGSESLAGAQRELVQDVAGQFEQTIGRWSETLQSSAQQWRILMQVPTSAGAGLQDLQRSVNATVESVVRTNLQATQQLFRLTNPAGLAELQQRFAREYLNALVEGTSSIVRTLRQSA